MALVRTDYVTRTVPLTAPHHHFLQAMENGAGVDEALKDVASLLRVTPAEARRGWQETVRSRWIDWGFFIDGTVRALLEGASRTGGRVV